jgi:hypothetical protein
MEEFVSRGGEGREQEVKAWLRGLHEQGQFRDDVTLENIVAFINVVANGVALATSLGLPLDADTLVKLVHQGIDPPK